VEQSRPFALSRVLLVESNAIIGLDLADELAGQGYEVAGPFACTTALQWLERDTPDLAVLDADLRSGTCVDLARELRARGVPILIFTCHDQKHALPEFSDLPWLPMPAAMEALCAALRVLPRRRQAMSRPQRARRFVGSRQGYTSQSPTGRERTAKNTAAK
jgi:DNA-binding response OmpR family regulator